MAQAGGGRDEKSGNRRAGERRVRPARRPRLARSPDTLSRFRPPRGGVPRLHLRVKAVDPERREISPQLHDNGVPTAWMRAPLAMTVLLKGTACRSPTLGWRTTVVSSTSVRMT